MEHLVQSASPRLYHDYWTACPVEEEDPSPSDPYLVKTGVGSLPCPQNRPKSVINWDAINSINEWEPKGLRVVTDITLERGNDDPTTQQCDHCWTFGQWQERIGGTMITVPQRVSSQTQNRGVCV